MALNVTVLEDDYFLKFRMVKEVEDVLIGIDDVSITPSMGCSDDPSPTREPFSQEECTFEDGSCRFSQDVNEKSYWYRIRPVSIGQNAWPKSDHTTFNSTGRYMLANHTQGDGSFAELWTPYYDETGFEVCVRFWLAQRGSHETIVMVQHLGSSYADLLGSSGASWDQEGQTWFGYR